MLVARSSVPLACLNKEEDQKLRGKKSKFQHKIKYNNDQRRMIFEATYWILYTLFTKKKKVINMIIICKYHEVQIPGTGRDILSNLV